MSTELKLICFAITLSIALKLINFVIDSVGKDPSIIEDWRGDR